MNSDSHNKILKDWRKRPQYKNEAFVSDGPVDWERWKNSERRVLFLAKEVNAEVGESWSLSKSIKFELKGPKWRFLWRIAYLTYGIQNLSRNSLPTNPEHEELWDEDTEALMSTAIVNIKKREGGSTSDDSDLRKYIGDDEDRILLREQVGCMNPNFIVCCNTWHLVKDVWPNARNVCQHVYQTDDMLVLDFWHPSNQFPNVMNYYTALALLQQAIDPPD